MKGYLSLVEVRAGEGHMGRISDRCTSIIMSYAVMENAAVCVSEKLIIFMNASYSHLLRSVTLKVCRFLYTGMSAAYQMTK